MGPLLLIAAIAAVIIMAGVQYYFREIKGKGQSAHKCLNCESMDMVEINRDTKGSRTVESSGGGTMAGGDVRLQLDYEITYHCNSCNQNSKYRVTKTF
ncbi:MAG: hypothetical protein AAF490_31615 [Chloroflexota bacterium]